MGKQRAATHPVPLAGNDAVVVRGARENNLKEVDISISRNALDDRQIPHNALIINKINIHCE